MYLSAFRVLSRRAFFCLGLRADLGNVSSGDPTRRGEQNMGMQRIDQKPSRSEDGLCEETIVLFPGTYPAVVVSAADRQSANAFRGLCYVLLQKLVP